MERADGYIDAGSVAVYMTEYKDWSSDLKKAMKFVCGKVIDIGCGAGRHAIYLQKRGFDVLGIDASPLAIQVCKQSGLKKAKVLPITKVTSKLGIFSTILMLGNNFGLFANKQRARWLLKRFYKMTTQNARIIAQSRNPYKTDDPCHLRYQKYNKTHRRMAGQIRLRVRYKVYVEPWYDYLIVSPAEMKAILSGTQWRIEKFIEPRSAVYTAIIVKKRAPFV